MTHSTFKTRPFLVFLLFFGLSVVYTWPLVINLFGGIPYTRDPGDIAGTPVLIQGDHLQIYYHISLLKEAFMGRIEWFSNPFEFAYDYWNNPFNTYALPLSAIFLVFSFISGPFAYNIYLLITLSLGGLSMYLWATDLTKSRVGGLMAAFVFNFIPVRMAEFAGGHPSGHAYFLFPLTLYFFDRAVNRRSLAYSALSGLCVLTFSFQYIYFCYYLLMFMMAYIPWRLIPIISGCLAKGADGIADLKRIALTGIPFAALCVLSLGWMFYFKKVIMSRSTFSQGRTAGEISNYSPKLSLMWDPGLDFSVYIGLPVVVILFGLFVSLFVSSRGNSRKLDILFFTAALIASYILAFGATLDGTVPLFSLFYNYFPYFSFSRVPAKIMIITFAMVAVLMAYFIKWAFENERGKKWIWISIFVMMAVTAIDYHPRGIGITALDEDNAIYNRLSKESQGKYVLNIPLWPGESSWESIYQYYAIQSRVPMINGYSPIVSKNHINNVFWPLFTINSGDITGAQTKLLKELNVSHLIFHEEAYPDKVSAFPSSYALDKLIASPYLKLIAKEEPLWLFELVENVDEGNPLSLTSPIGLVFQAEWLSKIGGKAVPDKDALNGYSLKGEAEKGNQKEKILNAGPYMTFPPGKYKAVFRVKVEENSSPDPVLYLDVAGAHGREILGSIALKGRDFKKTGSYQEVTLEYELAPGKTWQVEFRSYIIGSTSVYFDLVYVRFADQDDPAWSYEAEDLFHTGRRVKDKDASHGMSIQGTGAGFRVQGSGRWLDAGSYEASFTIKPAPSPKLKPLAKIEIFSEITQSVLAKRIVMRSDAPLDNEYQQVTLKFRLGHPDVLQYRIWYKGLTVLWVDKIEISIID